MRHLLYHGKTFYTLSKVIGIFYGNYSIWIKAWRIEIILPSKQKKKSIMMCFVKFSMNIKIFWNFRRRKCDKYFRNCLNVSRKNGWGKGFSHHRFFFEFKRTPCSQCHQPLKCLIRCIIKCIMDFLMIKLHNPWKFSKNNVTSFPWPLFFTFKFKKRRIQKFSISFEGGQHSKKGKVF